MNIYYFVCVLTLFIQWRLPDETDKQYRWNIFWSFVPLFLYGVFRVDFGLDYRTYEELFSDIHYYKVIGIEEYREEVGYQLLNLIMPSFRTLLIVTTLLNCASYAFIVYNYVPKRYSWLFMFFFFLTGQFNFIFAFSGLRNGITVSLLLLSTNLIRDRKWLPYLLVGGVAYTFHHTALLYFTLAYLIGRSTKLSKTEYAIWMVCLIILLVLPVRRITPYVLPYMSIVGAEDYVRYVRGADDVSLLIKFCSAISAYMFLSFMRNNELTESENTIGRLCALYFEFQLLEALSGRMPQTLMLYVISFITVLFMKYRKIWIRRGFVGFLLAYYSYGFFIVWQKSQYFTYQTYHSVLNS